MAQATRTICAHNAQGQVLVPGRPIKCIQCGAQIQPSSRSVDTGNKVVGREVNAAHPGDSNTTNTAWAFSK